MANATARALRKVMTLEEVILWQHLRELRPQGLHFRRQVPLGSFIVDFCCKRPRLVVEVDGGQHNLADHALKDEQRDRDLAALGYRVLRFWNSDVRQDPRSAIETILAAARR
jgi:very-short-patch-repair endonuclease